MKVKKYIAASMPEAMKVIRKELGNDAVILQSKEVRPKGLFGRFKKKKIEVIAAKDPHPVEEIKQPKRNSSPKPKETKPSERAILDEIKGLKKILELESAKSGTNLPLDYQLAYHQLIEQEVDEDIANELVELSKEKLEETKKEVTPLEINRTLRNLMKDKLGELSFSRITGEEKIVQFVGPTGVGKTTTIAKVAAKLMLEEKKSVAFITTDTYRIAAVEQLKTYARILKVPLEVAYHVEDYQQAIQKLASYDVILVDTAGRNFRNPEYIHQLKELMGSVPQISTYLVLSLTAKREDLQVIYDQFDAIPLTQLIFTKVDETSTYGSLFSIPYKYKIGIAVLTNGQDVPDDVLEPTPTLISEWIVRDRDA